MTLNSIHVSHFAGVNAVCEHENRVRNPSAYTCTCPPDYVGNPYDVCT